MRILIGLLLTVAAAMSLARAATNQPFAGQTGATMTITPGGDIYASTYNTGSFVITNTSGGTTRITRVRLDLTTALFPDLVFDPNGTAGDTVAKCFTDDGGSGSVGLVAPADPCATPFSGPHDGGYDTLQIDFTSFSASRTFQFSVDVDPTTIKGATAPGPNQSGSVSGLELTGATITITFSDLSVLSGRCFRVPGSDGSCIVTLSPNPLAAPGLVLLGAPASPATVVAPAQTAHVTGLGGARVALLQVEAALFTAGLASGGFDIDPFEANSAILVTEYDAIIGPSGYVDIPVTLTRTSADGGLNHLVAVVKNASGATGGLSPLTLLDYDDCTAPPQRSSRLDLDLAGNLSWTPLPGALSYDVVKGDLNLLLATRSYTSSILSCPAGRQAGTSLADPDSPAIGHGWYYVVRGIGCGGTGTWDDGIGTGQSGSRDAAIDAAPASCP
jgi:hypothetical protein